MKTSIKVIMLTGLLVSLSASAANQFCVVDNFGNRRNCHFSLATCQNSARYVQNAACVLVQDQTQQQAQTPIDPAQDIINKFTEARERRREQEERQARIDLMYAQQREIEQQSAYQSPACPAAARTPSVIYRCTTKEGDSVYSATPYIGCVVVSVN